MIVDRGLFPFDLIQAIELIEDKGSAAAPAVIGVLKLISDIFYPPGLYFISRKFFQILLILLSLALHSCKLLLYLLYLSLFSQFPLFFFLFVLLRSLCSFLFLFLCFFFFLCFILFHFDPRKSVRKYPVDHVSCLLLDTLCILVCGSFLCKAFLRRFSGCILSFLFPGLCFLFFLLFLRLFLLLFLLRFLLLLFFLFHYAKQLIPFFIQLFLDLCHLRFGNRSPVFDPAEAESLPGFTVFLARLFFCYQDIYSVFLLECIENPSHLFAILHPLQDIFLCFFGKRLKNLVDIVFPEGLKMILIKGPHIFVILTQVLSYIFIT